MASVMPFDSWHLLMILLAGLGFIGNSYEFYARTRGWPVGAKFPAWATASFILVPLSVGFVWYYRNWLAALITLASGFVLAWLLTVIFRQYVQVLWAISMLGVVASVCVLIVMKVVT